MALISCPNCGKEVSDKAKICMGCGFQLEEEKIAQKEETTVVCEDCGKVIPNDVTACPNCGCPITQEEELLEELPQKVEIAKVSILKARKFSSKHMIIAASVIVLIIVGIVIGLVVKKNNEERIKVDYANNLEAYSENVNSATRSMINGAAKAEEVGNLIKSVWYNTIYEESDPKTDKYTHSEGYGFNDDFNDSLAALFLDSSFMGDISDIEHNQEYVSDLMKNLQNPPEEYKDAYEAVKKLYEAYIELTNLVTDPSGSLQSFSDDFGEADSAVIKYYETMKMYIN